MHIQTYVLTLELNKNADTELCGVSFTSPMFGCTKLFSESKYLD